MPDLTSLSAAAIGAVALTEGIKFLYAQAGEILKRWRERRDKVSQKATAQTDKTETIEVVLPAVFEGKLDNPTIHFDVVQESEKNLRTLYKELSEYANEIEEVDETDSALLEKVDALRNLLEAIYQQRITLKGENRPQSGSPVVIGRVKAKEIVGEATGVKAETVTRGEIEGEVFADRIEQGGKATGTEVKNVGG